MTLRRGPQIVRSTFPLELRLRPGEVISLEA
jgi:hypothetical protein